MIRLTNIQLACYGLIASAFVLAGALVFSLSGQFTSKANAEMVIAEGSFSLMTTLTKSGEESLVVLDNTSATMLVYRLELGRKELVYVDGTNIGALFAGAR